MNSTLNKNIILFSLISLLSGILDAQYTLIPDAAFETRLISLGIDSEGTQDGRILTTDASSVTSLIVDNAGITDFTGIQAFTSLQIFRPSYNNITSLDLSALTQLRDLRATATLLESIDISNNPLLETCFIIASNGIEEIDLSNNPAIRDLNLSNNQLTSIDVSNLPQLRSLTIENNPLTSLSLSNNPLLNLLDVSYTSLGALDLSANTNLLSLQASSIGLTSIDLSNNEQIYYLQLNSNSLTSVDLSGMTGLEYFFCSMNALTSLDLSQSQALFRVNVTNNQLTSLNLKNGHNEDIDFAFAINNPGLHCVEVDDVNYSQTNWTSFFDSSSIFSTNCGSGADCSVFDTAPVDLNKSFNPVDGLLDRLQLKWYKESPEVMYTDEDAAACDIKYWPIRTLDPITGEALSTIADPDTIEQVNVRKYQNDGISPREIFKWPVKYRADGANNTKRAEPNTRYQWKVRCACEHGEGQESPWSEVKIFNTPDFDPVTGIFTPASAIISDDAWEIKKLNIPFEFSVYPNPSSGIISLSVQAESFTYAITDISGRMISTDAVMGSQAELDLSFLSDGLYLLQLQADGKYITQRFSMNR